MTDETYLSDREREAWDRYQTTDMTRAEVEEKLAGEWDIAPDTVATYIDRVYAKRKKSRATIEWTDKTTDLTGRCTTCRDTVDINEDDYIVLQEREDGEPTESNHFCSKSCVHEYLRDGHHDGTSGPSIEAITSGETIGTGRETRYREFRIVSLPRVDCSAEYVVVDAHSRDPVRSFDSGDFGDVDELREWLDEIHREYWGE